MLPRCRLIAVMARESPGVVPEAWRSYPGLSEARIAAAAALRDTRVLRIAIVEDGNPLRFVEWFDGAHEAPDAAVRLHDVEVEDQTV